MRTMLFVLLLVPSLALAQVPTKTLVPVVKVNSDIIYLRDKKGNYWAVQTNCNIDVNEITEFTIKERTVGEGTKIKISDSDICTVESISLA